MCGIAGKLLTDSESSIERSEIETMLLPMAHRGPDGQGVYLDRNVGLGHLRLSIIDLAGGNQPMTNEDASVWVVFNGEIYNFKSLRDNLVSKGHVFKSQSDTEVIVHLYEEFGVDCVQYLRGMFAFAIWDKIRRRLFVARDRVGIKPLYYRQASDGFSFASELKAIIADPRVSRELNSTALSDFFAFNYVPGDETLFPSIKRLLPGHYLIVENARMSVHQYWDLKFSEKRWGMPFDDVVDELYTLLGSTVKDHMIADVPVGILLSGGMDSSAVLSFAVQNTSKSIQAFTVGFDEGQVVDERPYARLAAARFGCIHREISITAEDFWTFLPSYVWHMEEPVCEPPAIALHYVSQLARNHVKVLLSGEGGDEAFGGYPNYPNMLRMEGVQNFLGPFARPFGAMTKFAGCLGGSDRLKRYGGALGIPLSQSYYSRSSSPTNYFNCRAGRVVTRDFQAASLGPLPASRMETLLASAKTWPLLDQMLYADTKTWLPDDLLVKADKITMASSLELRVPLLDHEVLEFAASLKTEHKVKGKETKRALKAAFMRILPPEVIARKKVGFPVPYSAWLRGPLRERVRSVLLSSTALARCIYNPRETELLILNHERTGKYSKEVFSMLVTEFWFRTFLDIPKSASYV